MILQHKQQTKLFVFFNYTILWCNGSTTGFGPVSLGSNPGRIAIYSMVVTLLTNIAPKLTLFLNESRYTKIKT